MTLGIGDGMTTATGQIAVGKAAAKTGIYNLHGQSVESQANHLPSGIYVVDGKKVMVK